MEAVRAHVSLKRSICEAGRVPWKNTKKKMQDAVSYRCDMIGEIGLVERKLQRQIGNTKGNKGKGITKRPHHARRLDKKSSTFKRGFDD